MCSIFRPKRIISSWINQRSLSLEYRFLSSMQGSLGVGANLNKGTPEDFATAKKRIAQYIRETVQRRELYRLITPEHDSEQSVTESVARDRHEAGAVAKIIGTVHAQTAANPS